MLLPSILGKEFTGIAISPNNTSILPYVILPPLSAGVIFLKFLFLLRGKNTDILDRKYVFAELFIVVTVDMVKMGLSMHICTHLK